MAAGPGTDASVRPARPEDAAAIAAIQARTLVASVRAGLDRDLPDMRLEPAQMLEQWERTLARPPRPGYGAFVALHGASVVGVGAGQPAPRVPGSGRGREIPQGTLILALEVDPRFRRIGHGSRLLAAMARAFATPALTTWVVAGDDARVRFYEAHGFRPAGVGRKLRVADTHVTEHLWYALTESAPSS